MSARNPMRSPIPKGANPIVLRNPEMGYAYVQVAMTVIADRSTEEREYRPFEQIRDNYPKYLLTRSDPIQQRDGIIHANIPEFIQEGRAF